MSLGKVCQSQRIYIHFHIRCIIIIMIIILHQIIIEVAQLRQHKQRLNDLRTQLG